jgi:hypothetical protein
VPTDADVEGGRQAALPCSAARACYCPAAQQRHHHMKRRPIACKCAKRSVSLIFLWHARSSGRRQESAIGQAELSQFPQAHQEELPPRLGDLLVGETYIRTTLHCIGPPPRIAARASPKSDASVSDGPAARPPCAPAGYHPCVSFLHVRFTSPCPCHLAMLLPCSCPAAQQGHHHVIYC